MRWKCEMWKCMKCGIYYILLLKARAGTQDRTWLTSRSNWEQIERPHKPTCPTSINSTNVLWFEPVSVSKKWLCSDTWVVVFIMFTLGFSGRHAVAVLGIWLSSNIKFVAKFEMPQKICFNTCTLGLYYTLQSRQYAFDSICWGDCGHKLETNIMMTRVFPNSNRNLVI